LPSLVLPDTFIKGLPAIQQNAVVKKQCLLLNAHDVKVSQLFFV